MSATLVKLIVQVIIEYQHVYDLSNKETNIGPEDLDSNCMHQVLNLTVNQIQIL